MPTSNELTTIKQVIEGSITIIEQRLSFPGNMAARTATCLEHLYYIIDQINNSINEVPNERQQKEESVPVSEGIGTAE